MSAELDALVLKVQRILTDQFKGVEVLADNGYGINYASTRIIVRPFQQEGGRLVVQVVGLMNQNVPVTPELFEWIARGSDEWLFGHVGFVEGQDGKADLVFRQALLGATLDVDELVDAVVAVGYTADQLDDVVHEKFGGERWIDPPPAPPQ